LDHQNNYVERLNIFDIFVAKCFNKRPVWSNNQFERFT